MASVVANLGLFNCSVTLSGKTGEVTNAENIKADTPKILKPTHFSGPKDFKAHVFLR